MSEISKSFPPSVSVKTEVRFFLVLTKGMYGITVVYEIGVLSVSFYLIAFFFWISINTAHLFLSSRGHSPNGFINKMVVPTAVHS